VFQAALLIAVFWFGWAIVDNTVQNLRARHIASGFGFLNTTAGFSLSFTLIPYSETSTYGRAILVGFFNTLLVASTGILAATAIGFLMGIMRLSRNWVISTLATIYIEFVRNVPLLLQIFIWYSAVLKPLPGPRQAQELIRMVPRAMAHQGDHQVRLDPGALLVHPDVLQLRQGLLAGVCGKPADADPVQIRRGVLEGIEEQRLEQVLVELQHSCEEAIRNPVVPLDSHQRPQRGDGPRDIFIVMRRVVLKERAKDRVCMLGHHPLCRRVAAPEDEQGLFHPGPIVFRAAGIRGSRGRTGGCRQEKQSADRYGRQRRLTAGGRVEHERPPGQQIPRTPVKRYSETWRGSGRCGGKCGGNATRHAGPDPHRPGDGRGRRFAAGGQAGLQSFRCGTGSSASEPAGETPCRAISEGRS